MSRGKRWNLFREIILYALMLAFWIYNSEWVGVLISLAIIGFALITRRRE